MSASINLPVYGMRDVFGLQLRKRNYVIRLLSDFAQKFGFQQLDVPVVERSSSFSEEIVGRSPWPEWDKRSCFFMEVNNYAESYDNHVSTDAALLNPEGTISVTRWLGRMIQENSKILFPMKLFYDVQCFRNELIDNLSETKHRQFRQFGIEIMGSSSLLADMEIVYMINEFLLLLGFPKESIVMRISDIRIFTQLIDESSINYDDSLLIKELMDSIAESHAGKNPKRLLPLKKNFWEILEQYNLTNQCLEKWKHILGSSQIHLSKSTRMLFGKKYLDPFDDLAVLAKSLISNGVNTKIDPCVVRSHEYYTGLSFEIDIVSDDFSFYEIAGGGRYDRLVSSFLSKTGDNLIVPSAGFAFGIERVIEAATHFGLLSKLKCIESFNYFDDVSADVLIVLPTTCNECDAYLEAVTKIKVAPPEKRYNVYVGDNKHLSYIMQYMKYYSISSKEGI